MVKPIFQGRVGPVSEYGECCWPECEKRIEAGWPLCERHYRKVGARFLSERSIFSPEMGREHRERQQQEYQESLVRHRAAVEAQAQVYYVRIGDYVKIGYSINVAQRMRSLRVDPDALLATEPGGLMLEQQRHAQFADERVGKRENFNPSRRLLAHIAALSTVQS